jgi:hypothetical protein
MAVFLPVDISDIVWQFYLVVVVVIITLSKIDHILLFVYTILTSILTLKLFKN